MVRFTRLLRDGGLGLAEAAEAARPLLADQEIVVRFAQFDDPAILRDIVLTDIGVARITSAADQGAPV